MHYTEVKPQDLSPNLGTNSNIRWLIREKDGARAFAMRYFQVFPGGKIFAHHHPWEHEIFVIKGKGRIRIGKTWYKVSEGFFLFIPPNVEHEYINNFEKPLEFICMIPLKPTAEEGLVKC